MNSPINYLLLGLLLTGCDSTTLTSGKSKGKAPIEYEYIKVSADESSASESEESNKSADEENNDSTNAEPTIKEPDPNELPPEVIVEEPVVEREITEESALDGLLRHEKQLKALCDRPGSDKVRQVFCSETPPEVKNLIDLQKALGLDVKDPTRTGRNQNGSNGNPAFTFTGHSSSLVARFVSSINPRAIIFTPPNGNNANYTVMGFTRGEQFVEVIANDPETNVAAFFLVMFEQECNEKEDGCTNGDLLTEKIEQNWTGFTIFEDKDLANTIFDCNQCHQPEGPGTAKILRMQELRRPWTHFFRDNLNGGQTLISDYRAAHGNETYAGIPGPMIGASDPQLLENLVRNQGFGNQPNEFPTGQVEGQVRNSAPNQPEDNSTPGTSSAWQNLYERSVRGEVIPPPHHDVKVTDPDLLADMTLAYRDFVEGSTDTLPDIREVFSEAAISGMSLRLKPGLDGDGILKQACAQCHNSKLDQSISRAKFNIDLATMSREEKDLAIERILLPENDPKRMPPHRFRDLNQQEKQTLIQHLKN